MNRNDQNQNQTLSANPGGWIFADPARQAEVERRAAEIELARRSTNPGGWVFADPERQLRVFRAARLLLSGNPDGRVGSDLGLSTPAEAASAGRHAHGRQATASTTRPVRRSVTSAGPAVA